MKTIVSSFLIGILFALGLGLSGMARPSVVLGFLDITGDWNPALVVVMAGAIVVTLPSYQILFRRQRPLFGTTFNLPKPSRTSIRLFLGSALFGVGWGLSGYCPGAGLVALMSGTWEPIIFTLAMLTGFHWFRRQHAPVSTEQCLKENP